MASPSPSLSTYTYTPLAKPHSSIRLLSVTSLPTSPSPYLILSLRLLPTLTSAPYTCLSYTWGPSHPTTTVICDGRPFEIRLNLYHALVHLHPVVPDKVKGIWVDAVCID